MAATGIPARCPACGTELRAFLAPAPSTQWFPCPTCHLAVPVVVPRDPPPLYTWEVLPGLYPPLDRPRGSRWHLRPAVAIALAATAIAAATLGGVLAYYGVAASTPGQYTISGVVLKESGSGTLSPAVGAAVVLTENSGAQRSLTSGAGGTFTFAGVPSGGVAINATLLGYAPETMYTFVTPVYNAGSSGLELVLLSTLVSNGTTVSLTPFVHLVDFLSSIYGGAALLGAAAAVAGIAAVATWRPTLRTGGVIGGCAGIAAPVVVYLLGLFPALPLVAEGSAVAAGFGGFAVSVTAAQLYRDGTPTGSD